MGCFLKIQICINFWKLPRIKIYHRKIFDAFIAEALPLYWGAPDAETYFPKESFEVMDFKNIQETAQHITELISNNIYDERLPFILEAKKGDEWL